jgi:hypothetical protein
MTELLILLTAIIFFFIGRFSQAKVDQTVIESIKETIKSRVKAGPIDYITPEEEEYLDSEDEKIDKEWKKSFKDAGVKV